MSILDFIGSIFKPAADLVDNVHTSTEEKLKLKNELAAIRAATESKMLELQSQLMDLQKQALTSAAEVAKAEAASESWLTRNYRPIILLGMFAMFLAQSFGLTKVAVPETFLEIFATAFGVVGLGPSMLKGAGAILGQIKKPK